MSVILFWIRWLQKRTDFLGLEPHRYFMLAIGLIEIIMTYFYLQVSHLRSHVYFMSSMILCVFLLLLMVFISIGMNYYQKLRREKSTLEMHGDVLRKKCCC